MELDILHKSTSPYIVEFYGAFFIESCVYYCMEYMDAGSLDKLYGDGAPEEVLSKIANSVRPIWNLSLPYDQKLITVWRSYIRCFMVSSS